MDRNEAERYVQNNASRIIVRTAPQTVLSALPATQREAQEKALVEQIINGNMPKLLILG